MKTIVFALLAVFFQSTVAQKTVFNHPFAPQEGMIPQVEQPYREEICLNGSWQFMPVQVKEGISLNEIKNPEYPQNPVWESVAYKVPSPWNVNSFSTGGGGDFVAFPSYPKAWENVLAGWVQKTVHVPSTWDHSVIKLHFEAVAGYAKVFINGQFAGDNFDIFLPFSVDVTPYAEPGKDMDISLWIAHGKLLNEPGKYGHRNYVSGSFWGIHIVGIWQDIYLQKYPEVYISDTYINPDVTANKLTAEVSLKNMTSKRQKITITGDVRKWINDADTSVINCPNPKWHLSDKAVVSTDKQSVEIAPGTTQTVLLSCTPDNRLDTWTPEHPNLYGMTVYLSRKQQVEDVDYTRFGWRQFKTKGTRFYLNDELIELKGDSWHFMGIPQMTRRYPYAWFRMLKDVDANAVRFHAQVYPRFYLDVADEMGICVLDETGIWSSDGGPKVDSELYWEACRDHVHRMVMRDRNHPAVFGWSVCNETLPVTKHVFHAPQELVDKNVAEINKWVDIVRKTDQTRNWISGDGETQASTDLPTVIGHYGGVNTMLEWKNQDKPWGIGETGMAYYGTPAQVAQENGDRAYESQEGRMEGLAAEAFRLIQTQRNLDASYACVFNLAWYGLQPLEFGLSDITRPVKPEDGIYFPPFIEGVPGVQPERLGPYTSTFNPGYDSRLPLYRPWPLYYGVKAAFGKDYAIAKNKWAIKKQIIVDEPMYEERELVWISASLSSPVKQAFENLAISFKPINKKKKQLIIIDGSFAINESDIISDIRSSLRNGSMAIVWNVTPKILPFIESVSGEKVILKERKAASYIIKNKHALLNGQTLGSLYFNELTKQPVSSYVITASGNGLSLLDPCNTDWSKWNYQSENIKTAMVLRSEREKKAQGSVLYHKKVGSGELVISSLDLFSIGDAGTSMIRSFLSNTGATFNGESKYSQSAFDKQGILIETLFCDADGNLITPKERAEVYLSFWIFSPRSLINLLAEPNMPRMEMEFKAKGTPQISVNGTIYADGLTTQSNPAYPTRINGLPLNKGWNHILLKASYGKDCFRFTSSDANFMKQIKTVVAR